MDHVDVLDTLRATELKVANEMNSAIKNKTSPKDRCAHVAKTLNEASQLVIETRRARMRFKLEKRKQAGGASSCGSK